MTAAIHPPLNISTPSSQVPVFHFLRPLVTVATFVDTFGAHLSSACFHGFTMFTMFSLFQSRAGKDKSEDLTLACPLEFGISQWNPRLEPRLAWVGKNCSHGIPNSHDLSLFAEKPMTLSTTNHTAHGPTKVKPLLSQFVKFVMRCHCTIAQLDVFMC